MADATEYGSAQLIKEVGWRLSKEITREAYLRDLAYAQDLRYDVNEWAGESRDGKPMVISWVAFPAGALLSAYEITARYCAGGNVICSAEAPCPECTGGES